MGKIISNLCQLISTEVYDLSEDKIGGIRCIDDRDDRRPGMANSLPDTAIPGGGAGLLVSVFGGLELANRNNGRVSIYPEIVVETVSGVIG
jgi:hypothetical protein